MSRLGQLIDELERLLGSPISINERDLTKSRFGDRHLAMTVAAALNDVFSWIRAKGSPHKAAQPEVISAALKASESSKNSAFVMLSNGGLADPAKLMNSFIEKYLTKIKEGVFRYNQTSRQIVFDQTSKR